MNLSRIFILAVILLTGCDNTLKHLQELGKESVNSYVAEFNGSDEELYVRAFSNASAADFMNENIPLFDCPDKELEKTYYFRWWTFRKPIKQTPNGYIISEFLPSVDWSEKYNSIACAAAHHIYEGRWLRDTQYIDSYSRFWFTEGNVDV